MREKTLGMGRWAAMLPLLLMMPALARAAGDDAIVEAGTPAATAFARYLGRMGESRPWDVETVEIDASLPKLKKAGRLRVLRRLLPVGAPQYQVLESDGDETVRQRVIYRYLTAEAQAAGLPAEAVAITPANYKFRYKGTVKSGEGLAYIFQITPHKNRQGLIKGELWLDGESGAVLRQSGRLVKSPSMFLKRVEFTREIDLHEGAAQSRVTHVTITARLVGTAELTIRERPYDSLAMGPVAAE